ncbi:TetR/AcrR family transcriptional regulator [Clostridium sp. KNHs216]|uniref:TetR/AcrR family transcriptional regulator n=1 Tax=Clostridium sp. KNHs216 TaxID=1550235 RepID=UPI0011544842|nr:TetR/AcrR family transcriptional regulator [Clostridium sp. KNHs216]TQI67328.1 TetR family transcriptional regulator [Clostridium sp. KNHs216]
MDKANLILDAMKTLLEQGGEISCSVSDIARTAGIGKGSIYYYYKSKDEIFDALVEREYNQIIEKCKVLINRSHATATHKFALLFQSYRSSTSMLAMDHYLHQQQNAAIHQKSLAKILSSLSPIVADIIRQGVEEKLFYCDKPQETAEIILSVYCFLYDPGIFKWTPEQLKEKASALAALLENGLSAAKGSFKFLYQT